MNGRLDHFSIVWHKREYRTFFLIMVLLSLAMSSTLPLVTLYLVDNLHAALSQTGIFFVGEASLSLILGLLVGRLSDRWTSRLPAMRAAAIWVAIGWVVFALSPYLWLSLAVGAIFLGASAIVMGQAFAALHDAMVWDSEPHPGLINTTVRTGFSLGFVVGPVLGSQVAALLSFRVAFLATACLNLLCLLPLHGLDVRVSSAVPRERKESNQAQSNVRLYVFVGLCMLVLTGTALKITYLPIDVTRHLGGSIGVYGTVMAVSAIAELITMPGTGLLAIRFTIGRIISLGLIVAIIEYVILSFNTALWQVYLIQLLDAVVIAVVSGLGLTYAQQLSPRRAGLASSVFGSAFGIATLMGNVIGSFTVAFFGIPHIFLIPLVLNCVALAAFIALDRTTARQFEAVSGVQNAPSDAT